MTMAYSEECALLMAMRMLLTDNWTQGAWGRNERGDSISSGAPDACSWCLEGSFITLTDNKTSIETLHRFTGRSSRSLIDFNDRHTHAQVLAALDRAIEASP